MSTATIDRLLGAVREQASGVRKKKPNSPITHAAIRPVEMISQRALVAGTKIEFGCHTLRAIGITSYPKNGGRFEIARQMVARISRTTGAMTRSRLIVSRGS